MSYWIPQLLSAAWNGQVEQIRELIEGRGIDVNSTVGCSERTALHNAAAQGHVGVVRYLLGHSHTAVGVKVNARDTDGNTPLHCASEMGHVAVVRALLDHYHCWQRQQQQQRLVSSRPPPNLHGDSAVNTVSSPTTSPLELDAMREDGRTALHLAVRNAHVEVVRMLLQANVSLTVRHRSSGGETPLHSAITVGMNVNTTNTGAMPGTTTRYERIQEIIHLLVTHHRTDPCQRESVTNAVDRFGRTPLLLGLELAYAKGTYTKAVPLMRILLQQGQADPNRTNPEGGWSALSYFTMEARAFDLPHAHDMVNLLLKHGASLLHHHNSAAPPTPSPTVHHGTTPLHKSTCTSSDEDSRENHITRACRVGLSIPWTQLLVSTQNSDLLSIPDDRGWLPIHYFARMDIPLDQLYQLVRQPDPMLLVRCVHRDEFIDQVRSGLLQQKYLWKEQTRQKADIHKLQQDLSTYQQQTASTLQLIQEYQQQDRRKKPHRLVANTSIQEVQRLRHEVEILKEQIKQYFVLHHYNHGCPPNMGHSTRRHSGESFPSISHFLVNDEATHALQENDKIPDQEQPSPLLLPTTTTTAHKHQYFAWETSIPTEIIQKHHQWLLYGSVLLIGQTILIVVVLLPCIGYLLMFRSVT